MWGDLFLIEIFDFLKTVFVLGGFFFDLERENRNGVNE